MSNDELAPGRVLHFNDSAWDALEIALKAKHLDLMAEHVAEQRKKPVIALHLAEPREAVRVLKIAADDFEIGVAPGRAFTGRSIYRTIARQIEEQTNNDPDATLIKRLTYLTGGGEITARQIIAMVRGDE